MSRDPIARALASGAGAAAAGAQAMAVSSTPLAKLLRAVNSRPRNWTPLAPPVMASPPLITVRAPYAAFGLGASSYPVTVDMNGNNQYFHMLNREAWRLITTYNGVNYYAGLANGSFNAAPTIAIGFKHFGRAFGMYERVNNGITAFCNGELVSAAPISTGTASGISVVPVELDFGSYGEREIIIVSRTNGFGGLRLNAGDTITPIDLSDGPTDSCMTDSYGSLSPSYMTGGGPFADAAFRTGIFAYNASSEGGSGYNANVAGGHTFADAVRMACLLYKRPSRITFAGGVNDGTTTAAQVGATAQILFAQARAACPDSVIRVLGPWFPPTSTSSFASARRDAIFAALQTISGPWYFVDNIASTWTTSNGKTGSVGPVGGWQTGDGQAWALTAPAASANSGTLVEPWPFANATQKIIFLSTGDVRNATLVQNSTAITWDGAAVTTTDTAVGIYTATPGNSVRFINRVDRTHYNADGVSNAGALLAQADIACIRALALG